MRRGLLVMALVACGGGGSGSGGAKDTTAPKPETNEADGGATSTTTPPKSDAGADAGGRPFAGSAAEATQLMTDAVDKKQEELKKCVQQYRFRTHLAHEKISVSIGIDQEGRVIGVTLPKHKEDKELSACVQGALRDVVFPRSHAGVITITRTFEEIVQ